jgi:hypothetical protein
MTRCVNYASLRLRKSLPENQRLRLPIFPGKNRGCIGSPRVPVFCFSGARAVRLDWKLVVAMTRFGSWSGGGRGVGGKEGEKRSQEQRERETAEAVPCFRLRRCTSLKRGVNDNELLFWVAAAHLAEARC